MCRFICMYCASEGIREHVPSTLNSHMAIVSRSGIVRRDVSAGFNSRDNNTDTASLELFLFRPVATFFITLLVSDSHHNVSFDVDDDDDDADDVPRVMSNVALDVICMGS